MSSWFVLRESWGWALSTVLLFNTQVMHLEASVSPVYDGPVLRCREGKWLA